MTAGGGRRAFSGWYAAIKLWGVGSRHRGPASRENRGRAACVLFYADGVVGPGVGQFEHATDELLVRACRTGDEGAWAVLVGRYQRLVFAVAVRAGLDEDLAGETFQRVFALLVEQLERIEQPSRIRAWLVTTASREARRMRQWQLRERPLVRTVEDSELETGPTDEAPLPDDVVLELEQRQLVRDALAALDPRCRELLRMLFYQREPPVYADVAAALGTPEGSIGPTRARCLDKLKRELALAGLSVSDEPLT